MLMDWRAELDVLHRRALAGVIVDIATARHDDMACRHLEPNSHGEPAEPSQTPMRYARDLVLEMQREVSTKGVRNPLVDFEFQLSLMPYQGHVYGIIYTEQKEWSDIWMKRPGVVDYSYWNNSDRPDEISDQEWDNRGKVWSAILDGHPLGIPAMLGFTAACTLEHVWPLKEDFELSLPTYQSRVQRCAQRLVHADMDTDPSITGGNRSWLATSLGLQALVAKSICVQSIIRDDLDLATLSRPMDFLRDKTLSTDASRTV